MSDDIVGTLGLSVFLPGPHRRAPVNKVKWLVLVVVLTAHVARADDCVDPKEKERLINAKRGRRADERDFVKAARHELTVQGGYYVSDLLNGTFVVGAAYTYHLTEDIGVEASFGFSRVHSSVAEALEKDARDFTPAAQRQPVPHVRLARVVAAARQVATLRRQDFALRRVRHRGRRRHRQLDELWRRRAIRCGTKVFLTRAIAMRFDLRDQLYREQILAVRQYVQDFSLTVGLSLFLP